MKKKFKIGDKVKLTAAERKYQCETAWEMCKVPNKGIVYETQALDYFVAMAVGLGVPYTAEIIGKCNGNFHVLINVKGIERMEHFQPESLK